jgi:hypothetical protein
MNPNHKSVLRDDCDMLGFAAVEKASVQEVRFTERVESFEQCSTFRSAGAINFLRLAAADLFRTMPIVERDAVDELQVFENLFEHNGPALRQYVRMLRALRGSL